MDEPANVPKVDETGVAAQAWINLWGINFVGRIWHAEGLSFNSRRGDIGQPGIALAKGNPLYRTDDFQELGFYKIFQLADTISMRFDLREQWVMDQTVEVYALTFQWVEGFDLFEDYFRKKWKGWEKSEPKPRQKSRLKRRIQPTHPTGN